MSTRLSIDTSVYWNHSFRDEEEYGSWGESKSVEIEGCSIVSEGSYCDLLSKETFKAGDPIHIVYVIYDTGDSFGWSEGNIEYMEAFHELQDAVRFKEFLELDYETYYKSEANWSLYPHVVEFEGMKYATAFYKGYFDKLSSVEIKSLEVS